MIEKLPHNAEAEKAVLGAVFRKAEVFDEISSRLNCDDFYLPVNREIFVVMSMLARDGEIIDEVTIVNKLDLSGRLKNAGGVTYITDLRDSVPILSSLPKYIDIVRDLAKRRRLIAEAKQAIEDAYTDEPTDVIISRLSDKCHALLFEDEESEMQRIDNLTFEAYFELSAEDNDDRKKQNEIMRPGFVDLERIVPYFQAEQLNILAAYTSAGKTTLALNIGMNIAKKGGAVMLFSLEMPNIELAKRALSAESEVDLLQFDRLDSKNWERLASTPKLLTGVDFWVADIPLANIAGLSAQAKKLKSKIGRLDLIIIDYLQLLVPENQSRNRTTNDEVAELSRGLKLLAKKLKVPILALSQLNRGSQKHNDGIPKLHDLRDSGAIEQDGDIIMILKREDRESSFGEAELFVLKNRNGKTGRVPLSFNGALQRFENYYDGE